MIHIDGSFGEGGGQILRYAIAFSTFTKQPIAIHHIRSKRKNPGLRPQHYTAITCLQRICNAQTKGVFIGSKEIQFIPSDIQPGTYSFDIGTAGSICLIFQTIILAALQTPKPITIELIGGTDVQWAPTWDYFNKIFLQLIKTMNISITTTLQKRGFYPKGQGKATLTLHPVHNLKPLQFNTPTYHHLKGVIHSSQLPTHINKRIKHSIIKQALQHQLSSDIQTNTSETASPGVVATIWTKSNQQVIGATKLGEQSIPSEIIATQLFAQLITEINTNAQFDSYGIDQILPYLVMAQNTEKIHLSTLTNHTTTTMWLLQQFFDIKFSINKKQNTMQLIQK